MIAAGAVLILIGVIVFVLGVRPRDLPEPEPESPTRHLEERKARIYEGLRDVLFEYRVGKLSDEDYQRTKLDLQKELAVVLAEIEKLAPAPAAEPAAPPEPNRCPHCGARFEQQLKFCGECGKPMPEAEP